MLRSLLLLLVRGQRIDRRILYLLLASVIALPFIVPIPVPSVAISPQTRAYYDTIESIAADPVRRNKLVIVTANYGSGTFAESQTQFEATLHHLMRHRLKFAIFAFNIAQGRELGRMAAEKLAPRYNYIYGEDYVHFGYRPYDAIEPLLKAAVRDLPGSIGNDINGKSLSEIPMMQNVKTVDDVGLIVETSSVQSINQWVQFFQRAGEQPIATLYSPTGVMAPEAFPLLKSGQLQGMLAGLNGAIEYESLLKEKGFGTRASASLSYAHVLILLLIILGNAGMFAARVLERQNGSRDDHV